MGCDCQARLGAAAAHEHWLPMLRVGASWGDETTKLAYINDELAVSRPPYRQRTYDPAAGRAIPMLVQPAGERFFTDRPRPDDVPDDAFMEGYGASYQRLLAKLPVELLATTERQALVEAKLYLQALRAERSASWGPDPNLLDQLWRPFELFVFKFQDMQLSTHFAISLAPLSSFERCGLFALGYENKPTTKNSDIAEKYKVQLLATARLPEGGLTAWVYKWNGLAYVSLNARTGRPLSVLEFLAAHRLYARDYAAHNVSSTSAVAGHVSLYILQQRDWKQIQIPWGLHELHPEMLYLYKQIADYSTIPRGSAELVQRFDPTWRQLVADSPVTGPLWHYIQGTMPESFSNVPRSLEERMTLLKSVLDRDKLKAPLPDLPPPARDVVEAMRKMLELPNYWDGLFRVKGEGLSVSPTGLIEISVPDPALEHPEAMWNLWASQFGSTAP